MPLLLCCITVYCTVYNLAKPNSAQSVRSYTQTIYQVASAIDGVFDVRRIKTGRKYAILKGQHSIYPTYFIYEESLLDYYVVSLKDSIYAFAGHREKTIKIRETNGVITSSLSQTLNNNALTDKLSNIYAWSIDFFRIQKGDSIAVIFEDVFVQNSISRLVSFKETKVRNCSPN